MNEENNQGRILYCKGKHGPWFLYARTDEEVQAAYLKVFKFFDEVADYYRGDLDDDEVDLYEAARKGDVQAATTLIEIRSDRGYEYEGVSIENIEDPFSE